MDGMDCGWYEREKVGQAYDELMPMIRFDSVVITNHNTAKI